MPSLKSNSSLVIVAVTFFLLGAAVAVVTADTENVWKAPTQSPPYGNVPPPINVGSMEDITFQGLTGDLGVFRDLYVGQALGIGVGDDDISSKLHIKNPSLAPNEKLIDLEVHGGFDLRRNGSNLFFNSRDNGRFWGFSHSGDPLMRFGGGQITLYKNLIPAGSPSLGSATDRFSSLFLSGQLNTQGTISAQGDICTTFGGEQVCLSAVGQGATTPPDSGGPPVGGGNQVVEGNLTVGGNILVGDSSHEIVQDILNEIGSKNILVEKNLFMGGNLHLDPNGLICLDDDTCIRNETLINVIKMVEDFL